MSSASGAIEDFIGDEWQAVKIFALIGWVLGKWVTLTLSLTGVGPFGPSLPYMQITLNVLKVRYRQKIGIPQAGS